MRRFSSIEEDMIIGWHGEEEYVFVYDKNDLAPLFWCFLQYAARPDLSFDVGDGCRMADGLRRKEERNRR